MRPAGVSVAESVSSCYVAQLLYSASWFSSGQARRQAADQPQTVLLGEVGCGLRPLESIHLHGLLQPRMRAPIVGWVRFRWYVSLVRRVQRGLAGRKLRKPCRLDAPEPAQRAACAPSPEVRSSPFGHRSPGAGSWVQLRHAIPALQAGLALISRRRTGTRWRPQRTRLGARRLSATRSIPRKQSRNAQHAALVGPDGFEPSTNGL